MPNPESFSARDAALREHLQSVSAQIGIGGPVRTGQFKSEALRRDIPAGLAPPDTDYLTLRRDAGGVLRWHFGPPVPVVPLGGRRAAWRAAIPAGTTVYQSTFARIPPNKVGEALQKLDDVLTPRNRVGLRRWDGNSLQPFDGRLAAGKRILLFVHGTFSNCDNTFEDLQRAPDGAGGALLAAAVARYDFVLTFDHPTIGVSPMVNAFDLACALRPAPATVDVVSHSRGGLVTRWYLEAFGGPATSARAVLVATTIKGTSLAAPPRLKAALSYLVNVGELLGAATSLAGVNPFMSVATGLAHVVTSVAKFTVNSPLLDSAVAMIPGLAGQSMVGNNPEILRLRANRLAVPPTYYAIKADFETTNPGWNILQYFRQPLKRLADHAADLVFEGPNDLVVDTDSMDSLSDPPSGEKDDFRVPRENVLDFGKTSEVFHTNYFRQARTVEFIRDRLGIAAR